MFNKIFDELVEESASKIIDFKSLMLNTLKK